MSSVFVLVLIIIEVMVYDVFVFFLLCDFIVLMLVL
jgi:hypothetical protein